MVLFLGSIIPLFLYVYVSENKLSYEIADIYEAFGLFITKTIKGKFDEEKKGNQYLKEKDISEREYSKFLTDVALNIYRSGAIQIQLPLNDILDSNESVIFLDESTVGDIIRENFQNKIDINKVSILNCYFFKKYENCWGFRDNNIVFFLIAKKIFEELECLCSGDNNKTEILESINGISLSPISYEFVFHFIERKNIEHKKIVEVVRQLIAKEEILSITRLKEESLSYNKLTVDIFFFIIFLRYNKAPFSQEINYILKRVSNYHSFAKRIDPNLSHIIKRYFFKSKIQDAELRRINLKGYNFDYSYLNDVKFIQNKVESARFNNVIFSNTQFDLCYLKKNEFDYIKGELEFKNSFLIEMNIREINANTTIKFIGCKIQKVIMKSKSTAKNNASKLFFKDCIIEQLSIEDSTFLFDMENCITKAKINIKNSTLIIERNSSILSNIEKIEDEYDKEIVEKTKNTIINMKKEKLDFKNSKIVVLAP